MEPRCSSRSVVGLNLLGVDGVVWRAQDTDGNNHEFAKTGTQHGKASYPHVSDGTTSHLLTISVFDSVEVN
jgi:hypothetical protein